MPVPLHHMPLRPLLLLLAMLQQRHLVHLRGLLAPISAAMGVGSPSAPTIAQQQLGSMIGIDVITTRGIEYSRQTTEDTTEALPPQRGENAGMTSEFAATEGKFDDGTFTDRFVEGTVETHDSSAYDANPWSDETGNSLNFSGIETPSEIVSDAAGLVRRGFADDVEGTEVGTSTVTVGQQLGPQDIDKLDLDTFINTALFSLPTLALNSVWVENIWAAVLGDDILMKSDCCTAEL